MPTDKIPTAKLSAKLTTREVCAFLQITPRTLQTLRDKKRLPYIKIGPRLIRYDREAVEAALTNGR